MVREKRTKSRGVYERGGSGRTWGGNEYDQNTLHQIYNELIKIFINIGKNVYISGQVWTGSLEDGRTDIQLSSSQRFVEWGKLKET